MIRNSRTDFDLLYRIHLEIAKDNFLKSVQHYFEEAGLSFEIVKKNISDKWNVFVKIGGIPMRLIKDTGSFKMIFQQRRIIFKNFAEFSVYNNKEDREMFTQRNFYSVEEVIEHFKKYDILNKINPKLRSAAKIGIFESFEKYIKHEKDN